MAFDLGLEGVCELNVLRIFTRRRKPAGPLDTFLENNLPLPSGVTAALYTQSRVATIQGQEDSRKHSGVVSIG